MNIYSTIEEYLKEKTAYNQPVNELWVVDNIAIKNTEIKKLLPNHFHPRILQTSDIVEIVKEFFFVSGKIRINELEKQILLKKIIEKDDKYKKFGNKVDDIINTINTIRLYPSCMQRIENLSQNDESLISVKRISDEFMNLYHEECNSGNFIDETDIMLEVANQKFPSLSIYDRIVIYGDFLTVDEITWKICLNYFSENTKEIVFVGTLADTLSKFFENHNFVRFQDEIKNFFYNDQEYSLYSKMKSFDPAKVFYSKFADWDEELNYIAQEIKQDILENELQPGEVAIYLPKRDLYNFKIEKVLDDFGLPYKRTFSDNLSTHPLGNFIRWLLTLNLTVAEDCMKLVKSPFVRLYYNNFSVPATEKIIFNETELDSGDLKVEYFDLNWLENILAKSGIEYINNTDDNIRKLEGYFKRKIQFDSKTNNSQNNKRIESYFLKSYFYLKYFSERLKDIDSLIPKNCYPSEFKENLLKFLTELNVDKQYTISDSEDKSGYYTKPYLVLKQTLEDIGNSLAKIENKEYSTDEYRKIFTAFAENKFIIEDENKEGILITELPLISKITMKRIYQVGMTGTHFPITTSKDAFGNFVQKFKPFNVTETQLLAFTELLNKTNKDSEFSLNLSYPVIIQNQEEKPSVVFADIKADIENEIKTFVSKDKIFSKSQKAEAIGYSRVSVSNGSENLLKHAKSRKDNESWSEYEGHLGFKNTELLDSHTSISKIEDYAACPMKYYFTYELGIQKQDKVLKDLDFTLKGSLVHKILEDFYSKAVNQDFFKNRKLNSCEGKGFMLEIADSIFKTYEESLNNLYIDKLKQELVSGLDSESKRKGILLELLEKDQLRMESDWEPTFFEKSFDSELEGLKFKGIIDRIDLKGDEFDIIDYKTGKIKANQKEKGIIDGLSFQLPVYSVAIKKESGKILNEAGYYALKKSSDNKDVNFSSVLNRQNQDKLIEKTIENLKELKGRLTKSQYNYTTYPEPEKEMCKYCDFMTICRYNSVKAMNLSEKQAENNSEELIIDNFIKPDSFYFPPKSPEKILNTNHKETKLTHSQEKALETNRNIIVTAGAGAGKTEVLTQRMKNLLKETKGNIERILVITFTKKATAEMQNRIYSSLVNSIEEEKDEVIKKYFKTAKLNFNNNWISTMDSFYLRLLRENFLDLDLDSEIEISDEKELYELMNDTVEKKVDKLASDKNENLAKLLDIWKRDKLTELLDELIKLDWIDNFIENSNLWEKYIEVYVKQALSFLNDKSLNNDYSEEHLKYLVHKLETSGSKDKERDKFIEQCKFLINEKETLEALVETLKVVKGEYESVKKQRNLYTFSDVSMKLYNLLKDKNNPKFREKLSKKFDFIMVDEFQDTNNYQFEIVKYLAGWDGKNPSTISNNKLFFVGDEKQAIYQFRGGDVQVFNSAKKEITEQNPESHISFDDNFRSANKLVEFFNNLFSTVLSGSDKLYEARPQTLIGNREGGKVNFFLFNRGSYRNKEQRQNQNLEPKFIAILIKKILDNNPDEEIAILFRTKRKIPLFASALEKIGIKYIISGGAGFYENQEIIDLMNIMSFITDQNKILELVGFLRSSFIGMSDKEIYDLKPSFIKGLKDKHPEVYEKIFSWKNLVCQLKIHELIEKIVQDTLVKIPFSIDPGYKQKVKNIERFIEISKEKEDHSIEEFIEFVQFQTEHNNDENSGIIIELGKRKPVQLMSIHKAKGLGFETVIIADGGAGGYKEHTESYHTDDLEIKNSNEILKEYIGFKVFDENKNETVSTFTKELVLRLINLKATAELKRLLYVAMTRAKNNLIFSATVWEKAGYSTDSLVSFLKDYFTLDKNIKLGDDKITEINGIPLYIFNQSYDITLQKPEETKLTELMTRYDQICPAPKQVYTYSYIKDKPELIREIIPGFDEIKLNIIPKKVEGLINIGFLPYLKTIDKGESERLIKLKGNVIHKILEYRVDSEEFAENVIRNTLPEEMFDYSIKHYRNIRTILEQLKPSIVSDYHELPFISGNLSGIFDKVVKTKEGWEIWDYKISDTQNEQKIIEEAENEYKVQYEIYSKKLSELLNLENVRYKLLFSNFGIVEITSPK